MKTLNQIYSLVLESIKDDVIAKFGGSEEVQSYVNKFWNEIRNKEADSKKKDIMYWLEEGFEAFKEYIDNFKSKKQEKRDSRNLTEVDNGNGKLLDVIDGYELWKVDSYEAAKFLGRDYKNMPSKWCISSDNLKHWNDYYIKNNLRFYFLISKNIHDYISPEYIYDKIAIQVNKQNEYIFWYANDKSASLNALPNNIKDIVYKIKNKIIWTEPILDVKDKLINILTNKPTAEEVSTYIENNPNICNVLATDINDNYYDVILDNIHKLLDENNIDVIKILFNKIKHLSINSLSRNTINTALKINVLNIKHFIELGMNPDIYDGLLLQKAFLSINNDIELVKILIENGLNAQAYINEIIHWLTNIHNGDMEVVKYFVKLDIDFKNISYSKFAGILISGWFEFAEFLVSHGFDIKKHGFDIVQYCLLTKEAQCEKIIKYIAEKYNIRPWLTDDNKIVEAVISFGYKSVAVYFIENGVPIKDILYATIKYDKIHIFKFIVEKYNIDINKDEYGLLEYAKSCERVRRNEIFQYLK
jgi:hypothetical protein